MESHKHPELSFIEVDEGEQEYNLSWDWQWKKCEDDNYYNKKFDSYYKAYNGRNYKAEIEFKGSKGTYKSDAGFTGKFYNVKYERDGTVAKGKWEAKGKHGWFEFRITDKKSGRFEGEWGDDSGDQGTWWGYYRGH